jgi:membrane protein
MATERLACVPAITLKDAWHLYKRTQRDRVLLVAAGVTFYVLLAMFPATAALVSLFGLFANASAINKQLQLAAGFLPQGAIEVIGDQVTRIAAQSHGALGLAFFSTLLLSLWGANAGTKALFGALNIIYDEREGRSFVRLTLQSMAFTLVAILFLIIAMSSVVGVPVAFNMLGVPARSAAALMGLLRWPALYLVILVALACLYRYGPDRARARWWWVTWGSGLAGAIWLAGSLILSWYVTNFGTYNATYGSLGAVIGFMIWLWLSTIVVLGGAEIDAELERRNAGQERDT